MPSYLDTRAVLFLHSGLADRISARAQTQIENTALLASPFVLLELEMLFEEGKIRYDAQTIISDLDQQIGLAVCQMPMARVVQCALKMKWTRDPGNRLIAAHAEAADGSPLITPDRVIREHYPNAIW